MCGEGHDGFKDDPEPHLCPECVKDRRKSFIEIYGKDPGKDPDSKELLTFIKLMHLIKKERAMLNKSFYEKFVSY
jgi:hypothetical protein